MLEIVLLFLYHLLSIVMADGMCHTCSVFSYLDNRLQCSNPSVCYAEYCYYYLTSDRRPLFIGGCVDLTDSAFFFYREDPRTVCRTEHHIGLCICRAEEGSCRADKNETLWAVELRGRPMEAAAFTTTGIKMDYVRMRILQMQITDFPMSFALTKDTFYSSTPRWKLIEMIILLLLYRLL